MHGHCQVKTIQELCRVKMCEKMQHDLIVNPEDVDTAVKKRYLEIAEDLLKNGANVNMLISSSFTSHTLLHGAVKDKQVEMAKLLINYGANVNVKDSARTTPIVDAIRNRDKVMTELLLTNGADIKENPEVLCIAAEYGCFKLVEDLLKDGANVNMLISSSFTSHTLLHSAVKGKQVEMAKLLINYGANVNVKDSARTTPIVDAIRNRDKVMTELLLTNGADIKENPEVLCIAAEYGCFKLVEDLLKDGANVNMLNSSGFERNLTPLHSAVKGKQVEMAKLLINYGANVNVKDSARTTPIVDAIRNRDKVMTELLLTNGADIKENPEVLCIAAEYGCFKLVEDLLKDGANVNMLNSSGFERNLTPLHSAVKGKQVEMAKLLINYGANVNVKNRLGTTPIVCAIQNRDIEMTELLLTNGADIKKDPEVLHAAAAYGCFKLVEDLLKNGANVNMLTRLRFVRSTPLHSAVEEKQVEMAKLLINYGANVNAKDNNKTTPIVYAIRNRDKVMTELLLTNGADIKENPEVLCTAAEYGCFKLVEDLLKDGANVNMLNSSGFERNLTPLHSAVKGKQVEMTKLLINYGANVNVKNRLGTPPIVYTIQNRDKEMTELLLTNGADIKKNPVVLCTAAEYGCFELVEDLLTDGANGNMLTSSGFGRNMLLHSAVKGKQVEMAKLLINYGANVNVKNGLGTTPIVCAIQNRDIEMTELLLTNGADIKKDPEVLYAAAAYGCFKLVEDLLKNGANVNMLTSSGLRRITLLHNAVWMKQVEMAKLLINYGANVNVKDSEGVTPILCAIQNRDTEMTELLLTNGADIKKDPKVLHAAAAYGCFKLVEDLLKIRANVNMLIRSEFQGRLMPLHSAVKGKHMEITKLLINYGANVNAKDNNKTTPIVYAIRNRDTEMTELLLTNGADIKKDPEVLHAAAAYGCFKLVEDILKNGANVYMLTSAVKGKQMEITKLLINYGANVNVKNRLGTTPIVCAIQNRDTEMTELLLTNGADIKKDPKVLHAAAAYGCFKLVEDLLKNGANVNMLTSSGLRRITLLHNAVWMKQVEMAKLLINYGANVNVKDSEGVTPILCAIQNRDTEMTELLLTNGADIKKDPKVLHAAAAYGCFKLVEDILKNGANVNMLTSSGFQGRLMPLHSAVKGKQMEITKLLINYGANVNVKDSEGVTPILCAIRNRDTEMTELLLTNGADIKKDPKVLHAAAAYGCFKLVEDILKNGANVNMLTSSGFQGRLMPLHSAVKGKQMEITKLLINYGANVNVKDSEGVTPILCAIRNRDTEMTELLLTNGVDIKEDPNLLCTAVVNASLEIVEDLLKYGADVNASDRYGRTALHYTVLCQTDIDHSLKVCDDMPCIEVIAELLLSKGANVNVKTKSGRTTLFVASQEGYENIVEILLKYDAECDLGAEEDRKPLHAAAVGGYSKIIEDLLKSGAKVDSRDIYGRTALHFAVRAGRKQIVETLLEYGSDVNIISKKNHTPLEYIELVEHRVMASDNFHYDLYNNDDFLYMDDSPITKLLIQHIAMMKAAGLHVSERNLLCISNDHEDNNFLNECEAEIEIMKSEKIDNSYASFYDILTKNTSQLAKNESIVQALKSDYYKTKFPIHASMIDSRFRRGVETVELLVQVRNKFLHFCSENLPELPLVCIENIFSYLSKKDLRVLLVACEP